MKYSTNPPALDEDIGRRWRLLASTAGGCPSAPARALAGALAAGALGATPALAQDAPPSSATSVESVIVTGRQTGFKADQTTANKSVLALRETPQSITVITRDLLDARQVINIGTALETSAGASMVSGPGAFAGRPYFGFGRTQIRGISTGSFVSNDREDGFRNPTFSTQQDLAPFERIEVVKGPSSALYGRGSPGGFINRVRKRPLDHFRGEFSATGGSYDFVRLDGDVTGPILGSGRIQGRLVAAYENSESFIDFVKGDRILLAPSLSIDITPSTRVLLFGTYQHDESVPSTGFPLELGPDGKYRAPAGSPRSRFFGTPRYDKNPLEVHLINAVVEQELGDHWLATLTLNDAHTKDRGGSRTSYAYGLTATGNTSLLSAVYQNHRDGLSGELRLNGDVRLFGRPAMLTAGVDYNRVNQEQFTASRTVASSSANPAPKVFLDNFAQFPNSGPGPYTNLADRKQVGTGLYAQAVYRPTDRLGVLVGARYDFVESSQLSRNLITGAQTLPLDKPEQWSGRVAVTYDILANTTVYAMVGRAFDPVLNIDVNGNFLKPTIGKITEAGVKSDLIGGRLGLSAAAFRIDRDSIPLTAGRTPAGVTYFSPSGLQRSDGVELELNGSLAPGWNLSFGGVLLDSKFLGTKALDPNVGRTPNGASDWQVGLFTAYELQTGPLKGAGVGFGLYAIGDRGVNGRDAPLDGYDREDVSLFYNGRGGWSFSLLVRNVLDRTYVESSDTANGASFFGSPRAALFTVRRRM
jgi:TonB-dependent siderophore receptor